MFYIFITSFATAFNELINNKLRAFLSLLGISIGIVCIISVLSSVDSLKANIKTSLSSLGNDVLYIQKWPWMPEEGQPYKWWEFFKRPVGNMEELNQLTNRVKTAAGIALIIFKEDEIAKAGDREVKNVSVTGITQQYNIIRNLSFQEGRYLTDMEFESGKNFVIIGDEVRNELFNSSQNPLGKYIEVMNRKYMVVGVLAKEGKDLLGFTQDNVILLPFNNIANIINIKEKDPFIALKAKPGVDMEDFKLEIKGIMRMIRKLKPKDKDNFSFNQISLLSGSIDQIFSILNIAAIIIGGFSILVGAFGVGNIMFVSVKERESQIGIKKALGARQIYILMEFLIEAIILCLVGGIIGLLCVYGLFALLDYIMAESDSGLHLFVATKFIFWGLFISIATGLIAGFRPAYTASKMNPVDAMRS
ncbi:MAG: ABC transporter permease [Chitinophagales bacterium]|nr:ABC transporter permease [Chitinophagales bacterium]